jgi:pimeloyl-ACP methyl ester carboxylesterase
MTLERSVRDLETVIREIGEPLYGLIGHSWGGAVVLLGGRRFEAVQRVVAIDPMIHQLPGWKEEFVDDVKADLALDRASREVAFYERYAGWDELDIQGKIHAMQFMSVEPIERLGSENRVDEGGWDLRDVVADYPKPLLLLLAGEDSIIPAQDIEPVRRRTGAQTSIETFAGEGHNLHRTAFDRFADSVDDFLTRTAT